MTYRSRLFSSLLALLAAACGGGTASDSSEATETYAFSTDDPQKLEIIDHMGTPLTSTSLANRDDAYQATAPSSLGYLPTFLSNLGKMHEAFAENLEAHGLAPCSKDTWLGRFVTPCTLQRLWDGGPLVSDVVVPDSIEVHLDEPARWPNGRPIVICDQTRAWASDEECSALGGRIEYLQINDQVLAMGFLDLGADCPGAPGGVCRLETFTDMDLNIDHNDAELPNRFPYLAPPHP